MKPPTPGGVLRLFVAIALTGVLLWTSSPRDVARALTGVAWPPLLVAVVLVAVDRVLMAYRWLVLLRPFAGPDGPRFSAVVRIFLVSTFVGTFLPGTVGGDAVRAYALSQERVPGSAAVASVLMDRLLGMVSILMAACLGLIFARQMAEDPLVLTALAITALACAAAAALVFSPRVAVVAQRLTRWVPGAAPRASVARVLTALQTYATRRSDLANVLAGSIGVQALRILQAYCLGLSLGMVQPLTVYVAFIPLILLVMLIPVTINGLGTSQAAFVWSFGQVGVSPAVSFTLSALFLALGVLGNLPGVLLYATGGLRRRPTP